MKDCSRGFQGVSSASALNARVAAPASSFAADPYAMQTSASAILQKAAGPLSECGQTERSFLSSSGSTTITSLGSASTSGGGDEQEGPKQKRKKAVDVGLARARAAEKNGKKLATITEKFWTVLKDSAKELLRHDNQGSEAQVPAAQLLGQRFEIGIFALGHKVDCKDADGKAYSPQGRIGSSRSWIPHNTFN